MVTRRSVIQVLGATAMSGGLIPGARAVVSPQVRDAGCRSDMRQIGPLLPTPPAALKRWMGARYGAFLCWSPSTLMGKEFSWTRNVDVPVSVYDNLYRRFAPKEFDADEWVRVLQQGGFRYAVFVTKHHDGFAMWNTKTTRYSIMNTPLGRDVLLEISEACRRANFPLCLYYSIADLYQPDCIGSRYANGVDLGPPGLELPPGQRPDFERYVRYMKAQLEELLKNYGSVLAWWFDGGWMKEWTYERGVDLLKFIRSFQPETLADQRVGCAYNGSVYMPTWFPTDTRYVGDYAVLEVDLPRFNRKIPWEYTTPANGRSYAWTPGPYGDPQEWLSNLVKSACGDGNYLLGLTPAASGRFDPPLVDKLREAAPWLERYGDAIFETRGGPYLRTNVYGSTCRGNRIYVHIYDVTLTHLTLPALPLAITGSYMLNGGTVHVTQSAGGVHVEIASNDMETPATIIVLEVNGSAVNVSPIGELPVNRNAAVLSSNSDPASNANVCDGDPCTYWRSDGSTEKCWLEFDLGRVRTVSRAILLEGYYQGEDANIREAELLVQTGSGWQRVAEIRAWGAGTPQAKAFDNWPMAVFHQEIRFKAIDTRHIWLKIKRATAAPVIHEFDVYER